MRACAPEAVKGECWVLTDGPEQLGDQPRWLTPGTHTRARTWWSGPCYRRSRGLAGHASNREGRARGTVLMTGLVVWASKPPNLQMAGFAEFGPQNSATAVPKGTGGDTWRDRGG